MGKRCLHLWMMEGFKGANVYKPTASCSINPTQAIPSTHTVICSLTPSYFLLSMMALKFQITHVKKLHTTYYYPNLSYPQPWFPKTCYSISTAVRLQSPPIALQWAALPALFPLLSQDSSHSHQRTHLRMHTKCFFFQAKNLTALTINSNHLHIKPSKAGCCQSF